LREIGMLEMPQGRILIVDDKANIREVLSAILMEEGYEVAASSNGNQALEEIAKVLPDIIITDIRMPGMDGIDFLKAIKEMDMDIPVVLITAYGSIESAVEAIKIGAYDYLTKPINHEKLKIIIQRALEQRKYILENKYLRRELQEKYHFCNIVGSSKKMEKVFEMIKTVSNTLSTVLIQGESGTGKELVARAIHHSSQRKDKPLIEINCSALSEGLLESELFGHEKGAFTGAICRKKGRIELSGGGTLFLDEVGEVSPRLQIKLLRVLQEKQFERVGGIEPLKVDFRLITATNKDLKNEVLRGDFREDLYYRLNVITLRLPSLRERREDIPLLISHFLQKYNLREGKRIGTIAPEVMNILTKYDWPGNVRELENFIERAVVVCNSEMITADDLPEEIQEGLFGKEEEVYIPPSTIEEMDLHEKEKKLILDALKKTEWNKAKAAKLLNVHRRTIYNRIRKYSLNRFNNQ
jgi:two-component system NtrC family response regulator